MLSLNATPVCRRLTSQGVGRKFQGLGRKLRALNPRPLPTWSSGDVKNDSAEILFQTFVWEAIVSYSFMPHSALMEKFEFYAIRSLEGVGKR